MAHLFRVCRLLMLFMLVVKSTERRETNCEASANLHKNVQAED